MLTKRDLLRFAALAAMPVATTRSGPVEAQSSADRPGLFKAPLIQPSEIQSQNGVLDATLTAAPGMVQLDDVTFPGFLYNNSYLPPLLRARAGDVMRIAFKNDLPDDPSNLHFHGMGVSPRGNSDNVFIHFIPARSSNTK